uniref:Uncharacterized protein n=1 Tax=Oryza nivara TaxID=4536 RepID=A0A0E0GKH7_ORYNI
MGRGCYMWANPSVAVYAGPNQTQLGRRYKTLPRGVQTTEKRAPTTEPAAGGANREGGSSATASARGGAAAASAPVLPGERASGSACPGSRLLRCCGSTLVWRPSAKRRWTFRDLNKHSRMTFIRPDFRASDESETVEVLHRAAAERHWHGPRRGNTRTNSAHQSATGTDGISRVIEALPYVGAVGNRRTKFPVSSSTAEAPVTLILVVQRMWPWESDSTMPELLVMARVADEGVVIGLSRLAIHTTLAGEKKPRAKMPPLEMSISLGKIGFPSVSWSSLEFNSLAVTSSEDQEKCEMAKS